MLGYHGSTVDGGGSIEAAIDCGALTACRRQPTAGDGGALCPCADPGTDSQARVKDGNALEQLFDALQAWLVSCGLSLWLLSFLGLLRMLFFAIQLKGGERNVDPAVRLGRRFLAGVPVRALFVVQFAGCCSIGQAMPAPGQDSWNRFTIFEMNSEMDVGVGSAPTVEFVGPALPTLFIPERDTAPWNWPGFTEDDEDSPDMQQEEEVVNWIAPVAVRSFECHDAYYTLYTRTDESVAEVCQEIVELVAEGEDDTIVLPVQPQPYSDIFETILTYTWVLGLGHVSALIDCSTFGQGRFVTYLTEPITIEYVQRIVGDKWREGAQIFCGNEEWPLRPREEHTSHHGILIRVHNPEEPRPDLLWAEQKLRCPTDWARDTRVRSVPQLQTGLGYVCLLGFCAPSVVIPARAPIVSLSMRDRVSDILHLQPESFLMKRPRGQILDLAVRGESARGLLGIQPWVTSNKLGVFVDPRHLGFSVAFCWVSRGEMAMADFCRLAGVTRPTGWEVMVTGAGGHDPATDTIWCREGDVIVLRVLEFRVGPGGRHAEDHSPIPEDGSGSGEPDDGPATDEEADGLNARDRSRSPRRAGDAVLGELAPRH